MNIKGIFLIIGIFLVVLKIKGILIVHNGWIFLSFFLWFVLLFISIHKKNKEKRTPRPVYIMNQ